MLIAGLLPLSVLICFSAMKVVGVDANIVALSGIAIAIGTMVDMGIVISENILKHLDDAQPGEDTLQVVLRASKEVGGAVLTAVATTVISFLPVFTMEAAEGKLFTPLAWTKTFALLASVLVAICVIPPFAHTLFAGKIKGKTLKKIVFGLVFITGAGLGVTWAIGYFKGTSPHMLWGLLGIVLLTTSGYRMMEHRLPESFTMHMPRVFNYLAVMVVGYFLAKHWLPLGLEQGVVLNCIFVGTMIGGIVIRRSFVSQILRFNVGMVFGTSPDLYATALGSCHAGRDVLVRIQWVVWLVAQRSCAA